MFCTESLMQQIAEELEFDPVKLREANFYDEGDCTPFGMHLNQCNIKRTWYECKESADYEKRQEEVQQYNRLDVNYEKEMVSTERTSTGKRDFS